jgi:hypothetical protein
MSRDPQSPKIRGTGKRGHENAKNTLRGSPGSSTGKIFANFPFGDDIVLSPKNGDDVAGKIIVDGL